MIRSALSSVPFVGEFPLIDERVEFECVPVIPLERELALSLVATTYATKSPDTFVP